MGGCVGRGIGIGIEDGSCAGGEWHLSKVALRGAETVNDEVLPL